MRLHGVGKSHRRLLDILADIDSTGPGRPERDVERLLRAAGNPDVGYQIIVLRHRHANSPNIGFLEAVSAEQGHGDLAGDGCYNWCESI